MVLKDYIKRGKTPIKESYYKRLAEVEASNNPNAQAKTSSAAGLYQFTKGTWNGLTKQMGLDYSEDDRFDPIKSRQVVEEFTRNNKNYLMRKLGREPNEAELYLAHFQGMGGANKILSSMQSNPHARVDSIVHQNVINANKNVFFNKDGSTKEIKDIYNWAAEKFGVQGYKEEEVVDVKPSFEMETREPVVIDNTAVRQPIFEPIQPAKFNELFRFDNTPTELPEYDTTQQEEVKQKIPTYIEEEPIKYDTSLYDYIQLEEFQDGGEYNEEKNWLEDWYKNRVIKNDYINEAVQRDKKDILKRASTQPDIERVDSIENNVHGRYLPKQNRIVLDKKATTIDALHEYDHFLTDIPLYSRTTDSDVINKNIRSREHTQGVYKDKYDYFTSQPEIKARVMNLRREADIKPDEHVTKEKLINFLQKDYKGDNSNINDLYHLTPNVESLLEILNNTASLNQKSNKNYS